MQWKKIIGVALMTTWSWASWGATPSPHENTAGNSQSASELWSGDACRPIPAAENTKLGIIRQMLMAGKPHAAIAYLDAAHINAPQADLLRADALRQTGREEDAGQLYKKLLRSCMAGYAYQGLGLSASKAGRTKEAVTQLQAAAAALPIDALVRNNYGYALMAAGNDEAALHEFLTAIELAPDNRRAAHNLVLLLCRKGEDDKAKQFADQFGLSADEYAELKDMAHAPLPSMANEEKTSPAVAAAADMTEPAASQNDEGSTK